MVSLTEWERFHGHDLALLDDLALQRERRCVQRRLDYEPDVLRRAWLAQRLAAIDRELSARESRIPQHHEPRRYRATNEADNSRAPGSFEYRRGQVVKR